MSFDQICLPPSGTENNTLHELSDHVAIVEFLWLDGRWRRNGQGNSPSAMAEYGWFYKKPVASPARPADDVGSTREGS